MKYSFAVEVLKCAKVLVEIATKHIAINEDTPHLWSLLNAIEQLLYLAIKELDS